MRNIPCAFRGKFQRDARAKYARASHAALWSSEDWSGVTGLIRISAGRSKPHSSRAVSPGEGTIQPSIQLAWSFFLISWLMISNHVACPSGKRPHGLSYCSGAKALGLPPRARLTHRTRCARRVSLSMSPEGALRHSTRLLKARPSHFKILR